MVLSSLFRGTSSLVITPEEFMGTSSTHVEMIMTAVSLNELVQVYKDNLVQGR